MEAHHKAWHSGFIRDPIWQNVAPGNQSTGGIMKKETIKKVIKLSLVGTGTSVYL